MGLGVGRAEDAAAVEVVTGPPVPEVVEVESRRLHGGRVARLHPAEALEARNRVRWFRDRRSERRSGITACDPVAQPAGMPRWAAMSMNLLNTTPMEDTTSLTSLAILPASHTVTVPVTGLLKRWDAK